MLKLMEVSKRYHREQGLKNVSLTILPEKLYLFVGENGSGKSTTMKLIANVIFHTNREGKIENGFKKIIYLPDKRCYPTLLTVTEYLKYYLERKVDFNNLKSILNRYNLPNKKIHALSKGMLQKLGIIQTILSEGELYLFDEPTDGLDGDSVTIFKEDVNKLLETKKTVIISTHNRSVFRDLKPKIYHFKQGCCYEK